MARIATDSAASLLASLLAPLLVSLPMQERAHGGSARDQLADAVDSIVTMTPIAD